MTTLTIEELKILVNLLGQATTTVAKAQIFINLINKMSFMIDEQTKKKNEELEAIKPVKVQKVK